MRINLVDIDSTIPNLALMKISAWHKIQGDITGLNLENADKSYASVIFPANHDDAIGYDDIGGTGWDINKVLPHHIEFIKPDYDLYPSTYSQGFTTRGCVRRCKFCFVPDKEGAIQIWQHPSKFHDERLKTCMIMDNNIFGAGHEWCKEVFGWYHDNNVKMLEHGMDIRLLDEDLVLMLADIKLTPKGIHFAWDNMGDEKYVRAGIKLLEDAGFNLRRHISFYVLAGYNTTFEQDLYRCETLKELGCNAYVMRYKKDKWLNALARWTNARQLYWTLDFWDYLVGKYKWACQEKGSPNYRTP
jgi:hypothetical protein